MWKLFVCEWDFVRCVLDWWVFVRWFVRVVYVYDGYFIDMDGLRENCLGWFGIFIIFYLGDNVVLCGFLVVDWYVVWLWEDW